jgi:hypothetical protein
MDKSYIEILKFLTLWNVDEDQFQENKDDGELFSDHFDLLDMLSIIPTKLSIKKS